MTERNYSGIFNIKDTMVTDIVPKYFDEQDVNLLNTGIVGYTSDVIGTHTEDLFNTVAVYINERFINTAILYETIYNHLTLYRYTDILARPSTVPIILFVSEAEILKRATMRDGVLHFILDQTTLIDLEGHHFMFDYDIDFSITPYKGDHIYTIKYDFSYKNNLSKLQNPYVKFRKHYIGHSATGFRDVYLALFLTVRQVEKRSENFNLITNDKINIPTLSINYTGQLAGFEVFYKTAKNSEYIQLEKILTNNPPSIKPFCFYTINDDSSFRLSFTRDPKYFSPEFNSDIMVEIYTTTGGAGNFKYLDDKGEKVNVIPVSNKYQSNRGLKIFAKIQGDAVGGRDQLSFDALKQIVIQKMTTVDSFTTENDLQQYFDSFIYDMNIRVLFIKKRDDVFERLFSSFMLVKRLDGDFYQTNTCSINMKPGLISDGGDFDEYYSPTKTHMIRPGHIFKFKSGSIDTLIRENLKYDDIDFENFNPAMDDFYYVNPFLMTVTTNPIIVGYYLNSINRSYKLEYDWLNDRSLYQFILSKIDVVRDAIRGDTKYIIYVTVSSASDMKDSLIDPDTGEDLNIFKIKGVVDGTESEICFFDFKLDTYDEDLKLYRYKAEIETNDYITGSNVMLTNVKSLEDSSIVDKLVPLTYCNIKLLTFYKYESDNIPHQYNGIVDIDESLNPVPLSDYTLTNIYSINSDRIDWMKPLDLIRSFAARSADGSLEAVPESDTMLNIASVPFVGVDSIETSEIYFQFINGLMNQYESMMSIIDKVTNNFRIDVKFFNTYGKSRIFVVGEAQDKLNRVNSNITFEVGPHINIDSEILVRDIKIYIKDFIEKINDAGYNSFFVSNLIRGIETEFPGVKYLKFKSFNGYSSNVQAINNLSGNFESLTLDQKRQYVPEFLTIKDSDIRISLI